ncbi:acyltransferase [Chitinophaga pendula]|uniref:acyltransferase family protein n=1 Tax=Chitinophaga TaxID=79328 RepID=UPI000BB059F0|nr:MULTISPECIES: acyltransferase [Chitinophaga]ASZ14632.1 hypothetical protein CK934_28595 [Chitinophaga sp. MD30]UCJ07717.1 acyltransferase [Chitinophaga pendula]
MTQPSTRNDWVDNLRSFITLLVIAHHASLAYATFGHFNPQAYILSTHPVVDNARSKAIDIFLSCNDIFFMSLMFLISGIFVMPSLQRKGIPTFIRDRRNRLFIPFLVGVTLLMMLAYYPAYYQGHPQHGIKAYIIDYFTTEAWPVGPPWFIWLLYFYSYCFAKGARIWTNAINRIGKSLAAQQHRPFRICLVAFLYSWILYVPITLIIDPGFWIGIGPFDFQLSRFFLYGGYFVAGAIIGAPGLDNGILAINSPLVKKWPLWIPAAIAAFLLIKATDVPLLSLLSDKKVTAWQYALLHSTLWILSCTLTCIAFLTLFRQLISHTSTIWRSLAANAYGMYLLHYIFVVWCQYFLLPVNISAISKFLITTIVGIILSWCATVILRKSNWISKYL